MLRRAWKWLLRQLFGNPHLTRYVVQTGLDGMFEKAKEKAKETETDLDDDAIERFEDFIYENRLDAYLADYLQQLAAAEVRD